MNIEKIKKSLDYITNDFDTSVDLSLKRFRNAVTDLAEEINCKRLLSQGGVVNEPAEGVEALIGKQIRFGGMEWTVLEQDDNTIEILSNNYLPDEYEFGRTNIWARSTLRKTLHEWLKTWAGDNKIEEYVRSMYVASMDEASEVLDESIDQIRLLTLEEQLRYRRLGIMPKYTPGWQWTITAGRGIAHIVWGSYSSGHVDGNYSYCAARCAPALIISLDAPFELIS